MILSSSYFVIPNGSLVRLDQRTFSQVDRVTPYQPNLAVDSLTPAQLSPKYMSKKHLDFFAFNDLIIF